MLTDLSATDAFEADSEGSDNEHVPKITISGSSTSYSSYSDGPPTIMSPNKGDDPIIVMADQNGKCRGHDCASTQIYYRSRSS